MALLWALLLAPRPAFADACTDFDGNGIHFGLDYATVDQHVAGIRAPIQKRVDGGACSGDPKGVGSLLWIGLGIPNTNHLNQIGYYHFQDPDGSGHFCKFYEILPAMPTLFDCGKKNDKVYTFFEILKYTSPFDGKRYYEGFDCGLANPTYNSNQCSMRYSNVPHYNTDQAFAWGESQLYYCQIQIMGNKAYPANIGNGTNPAQVEPEFGGPWQATGMYPKAQDAGAANCSHYQEAYPHTNVVTTWDDRNAS